MLFCYPLLKLIHQLRLQLAKEKLDRARVEAQLKNQHKESLRQEILHTENLKTLHEQDVEHLQRKITDLLQELKGEKEDHARTKRGLEHLRTHFASLPIERTAGQSGAVVKNQLTKLQYS